MAYRVCRASGWRWLSPQQLWEEISFKDWLGIVRYSEEEPWGEIRDDLRMASVVANIHAPFCKQAQNTPNLIWPYIESDEDVADEARKVLEHVKANYGDIARQHGDSPGHQRSGDAGGS